MFIKKKQGGIEKGTEGYLCRERERGGIGEKEEREREREMELEIPN